MGIISGAVLQRFRIIPITIGGLACVVLLLWAVVAIPPHLIDISQIADPAKRLDEVNALRTSLLGVLGGLAVVAGAAVGALNFRETSRQNRAVLELQRRGQVTERFTRAIEQLGQRGEERLDVRIGAVYALEQIAQDSAELHWPIMEVLTAHLREHAGPDHDVAESSGPSGAITRESARRQLVAGGKLLPADQQATATVIGRRRCQEDPTGQRLDMGATSLPGVRWREAHLVGANLHWAQLEGADLHGAHLEGADLSGAELEVADLGGAHLEGADLRGAKLVGSGLVGAHLEGADLRGAHLVNANLNGAHLAQTDFDGAYLQRADLRGAQELTVGQLHAAQGVSSARLPGELASQMVRSEPAGGDGPRA